MKTLEQLRNEMDTNGYAHFNYAAFLNRTDEVCYIPENADSIEDLFTYDKLKSLVDDWCEEYPFYLEEHETDNEAVLNGLFENIEWTFPSTYLDALL